MRPNYESLAFWIRCIQINVYLQRSGARAVRRMSGTIWFSHKFVLRSVKMNNNEHETKISFRFGFGGWSQYRLWLIEADYHENIGCEMLFVNKILYTNIEWTTSSETEFNAKQCPGVRQTHTRRFVRSMMDRGKCTCYHLQFDCPCRDGYSHIRPRVPVAPHFIVFDALRHVWNAGINTTVCVRASMCQRCVCVWEKCLMVGCVTRVCGLIRVVKSFDWHQHATPVNRLDVWLWHCCQNLKPFDIPDPDAYMLPYYVDLYTYMRVRLGHTCSIDIQIAFMKPYRMTTQTSMHSTRNLFARSYQTKYICTISV